MRRAYLGLGVVTIVWGFYYLGIDSLLASGWDPVFLNAMRFTIASAALVFVVIVRGQGSELIKVQREGRLKLALPAWAGVLAGTALITFAQQSVASGLASVIMASTPLFAAILGVTVFFGRRRVGPLAWLGVAIGLFGVGCLYLPTIGSSAAWGVVMLLFSAVCFAFEAHCIAKWFSQSNLLVVTALVIIWAAIGFWGWALVRGSLESGSWLLLVAFALLSNAVAFTVYLSLVRNNGPTFANVHAYLVPVLALLIGWMINAESLTLLIIAGSSLSISGAILVGRDSHRRSQLNQAT